MAVDRRRGAFACGLVMLALLAGCGREPDPPRSVVVVSIDTLRADRVGGYGNRGLTPTLDRLAAEGVLFENAVAPTPITLPSHSSLFTGRYPTSTGVRNNGTFVLPGAEVTLAEALREAGWETGAVVASFPLKRRFGLDQGFRIYDDDVEPPAGRSGGGVRIHFVERNATAVTDRALQVWRGLGEGRRMLWVHYFDPHAPYAPPLEWARKHTDLYDAEVAYTDAEIGRLLDTVLVDDPQAIVAVVADHGEALGDHGEANHGLFLYESTVRVPMILRAPQRLAGGKRVAEPVSLVDVMPTLLGLVGLPAPAGTEGTDLRPVVEDGATLDRGIYAETFMPRLDYRFSELVALRSGPLKYIDAPQPELYDLAQDPGETENLYGRHPDEDALAAELRAFVESASAPEGASAGDVLDAETEAKLRSLGYIAGGSLDLPDDERGRDPKDMRGYFARHGEANTLLAAGRYDEGVALLRELVDQAPENFMIHQQIASALISAGRNDEAELELELLVAAAPELSAGYRLLAETQARQGKIDAAIASYRAAAEAAPEMGRPWHALGAKLEEWGRFDDAAEAYREAIAREPTEPRYVRSLLELRGSRGDLETAVAELAALAEMRPEAAALWDGLGMARRRLGDPAAALADLGRALELEPYRFETLTLIGEIQLEGRNAPVAEQAFRRALDSGPDRPEAWFGLARTLLAQDRVAEGDEALARVIELAPDSSAAWAVRGRYLESQGNVTEALAAYREALRLNPGDRQAREGSERLSR